MQAGAPAPVGTKAAAIIPSFAFAQLMQTSMQ